MTPSSQNPLPAFYRKTYKDLIAFIHLENLSTYYILPLMELPKRKFGDSNFFNSYLSLDGKFLYVLVYDLNLVQDPWVLRHPNFRKSWYTINGATLMYRIPATWRHEVHCYLTGKYTLFTDEAKEIIHNSSGLCYRTITEDGGYYTDPVLLALDRSPELLRWLEAEFDCPIELKELLPPPGRETYLVIT